MILTFQKSTFVVGMVCCDGEGHLNEKSILLQGRYIIPYYTGPYIHVLIASYLFFDCYSQHKSDTSFSLWTLVSLSNMFSVFSIVLSILEGSVYVSILINWIAFPCSRGRCISSCGYMLLVNMNCRFNELNNLEEWPFQVIGVEGHNPSGHCFIASKLVDSLPLPVSPDEDLPPAKKQATGQEVQPIPSITPGELSLVCMTY